MERLRQEATEQIPRPLAVIMSRITTASDAPEIKVQGLFIRSFEVCNQILFSVIVSVWL
jgi:hypothetical protein